MMESDPAPSGKMSLHLDSILEELGNFGKYQIKNYIWIVITIALNACYTLSYVFSVANTPHRCLIPECDGDEREFHPQWLNNSIPMTNGNFESCTRFAGVNSTIFNDTCPSSMFDPGTLVACSNWVYQDYNSIVGEFDMGCEDWKRTMIGTINNVGQSLTMPLTGYVSDKYGRKVALIAGLVASGLIGAGRAFSQNYWTFFALELIDPLLGSGTYSTAFILGVELVGPKYRILGSTLICMFYAVGEVLLGILAYYFPYWRTMLLICYVPAIFIFIYIWLIPESVRWLISKGRTKEAGDILKEAAKVNNVKLSEKALHVIDNADKFTADDNQSEVKIPFKAIFKSKIIVVRVIVASFWWITCTFVFYGLSLNSVEIAGDPYLNFILVSIIEIPAYVLYYLTVDRYGRKITSCASFIGSAIACFAFPFIPEEIFWLKLSFYLLGKLCITASFSIVYVYTTEIFPTSVRHSLLAICSMVGRIGSIIAPQTPLLSAIYEPLPLLLFGATSLISGVTVCMFPETHNIKLPDTIEEAENISKQKNSKDSVN